jgi:hypothetical protein
VPFTLRNLKADLEDVGSNFDGAPDLEFRLATDALELEKSGLSFQSVPPTTDGARVWLGEGVRAAASRAMRQPRLTGGPGLTLTQAWSLAVSAPRSKSSRI